MSKARPSKEFKNFAKLTERLLTVPRDVVNKRMEQHREQAANNPRKRGPKKKISDDASSSRREDT